MGLDGRSRGKTHDSCWCLPRAGVGSFAARATALRQAVLRRLAHGGRGTWSRCCRDSMRAGEPRARGGCVANTPTVVRASICMGGMTAPTSVWHSRQPVVADGNARSQLCGAGACMRGQRSEPGRGRSSTHDISRGLASRHTLISIISGCANSSRSCCRSISSGGGCGCGGVGVHVVGSGGCRSHLRSRSRRSPPKCVSPPWPQS